MIDLFVSRSADNRISYYWTACDLTQFLQIVADGDAGRVQNQSSSVSKEAQTQPPPVSKESLKTPPVSGMDKKTTRDALEQACGVLQTYDAEPEEKRQEAAELQQEREHDGRWGRSYCGLVCVLLSSMYRAKSSVLEHILP